MLADLKTLLGITDTAQDNLLNLLLRQVSKMVRSETNQDSVSPAMQSLIVEMAADAYWLRPQSAGEIAGAVSSVSDNGQTVAYRESAYAQVLSEVSVKVLKSYGTRMDAFRRPRW